MYNDHFEVRLGLENFFLYNWKLYLFFSLTVFLPQILLFIFPDWNIPGLGLAFVGIIFMTKLMGDKDRHYLDKARGLAATRLKKRRNKEPKKGEVEILAEEICQARLFAFYFSGALAIALGFLSSVN